MNKNYTIRNNNDDDNTLLQMETKRRKAEDSVKKADVEYYTYCIRAERARWLYHFDL